MAAVEGREHDASRKCIVNGHIPKVVEKQRRNKMKALCSTLILLLPEEFNKVRFPFLYLSHINKSVTHKRKGAVFSLLLAIFADKTYL